MILDSLHNAIKDAKAFMYHSNNCCWYNSPSNQCNCGYFEVKAELNLAFNNLLILYTTEKIDYTKYMREDKSSQSIEIKG